MQELCINSRTEPSLWGARGRFEGLRRSEGTAPPRSSATSPCSPATFYKRVCFLIFLLISCLVLLDNIYSVPLHRLWNGRIVQLTEKEKNQPKPQKKSPISPNHPRARIDALRLRLRLQSSCRGSAVLPPQVLIWETLIFPLRGFLCKRHALLRGRI